MRFKMDYDNTPGVGLLFLFYINDDGSMKLATPEDVQREIDSTISTLREQLAAAEQALRTIHNKHGVIDCVSYTRKRIVADYQRHREWVQSLVRAVLNEDGPALFPELPRGGYGKIQEAIAAQNALQAIDKEKK